MKFLKIFAIALAAVGFAACSDNDTEWNTAADVTVEMGSASVSYKEARGLITIPIVVNGEANGDILVTVAAEETGANPAQDDVHFYMTTKSIVLNPGTDTYNFEIIIGDDELINDPRTCDIKIVDVKGATIGAQNFTALTIRDNDADFYDKLTGKWTLNALDAKTGEPLTYNVVITGGDEDEPGSGYNEWLTFSIINQGVSLDYQANYFYDKETNEGYLELPFGQSGAQVNFSGLGVCDVVLMWSDDTYVYEDGSAIMTWDSTFKKLSVESSLAAQGGTNLWYLGVFSGNDFMGGWGRFIVVDVTR